MKAESFPKVGHIYPNCSIRSIKQAYKLSEGWKSQFIECTSQNLIKLKFDGFKKVCLEVQYPDKNTIDIDFSIDELLNYKL